MKRFSLFDLLKKIGMFGSFATDDNGAGADGDNGAGADGDNGAGADGDNGAGGSSKYDKYDVDIDDEKTNIYIDDIRTRLEEAERKLAQAESEKILNNEIKRLSEKHNGFEAEKVRQKLIEINKSDPARAEQLNNPIGWELLWISELAPKTVNNDDPSFGRNIDPVDRSDEIIQKIKDGGAITFNDKVNVLGKYF